MHTKQVHLYKILGNASLCSDRKHLSDCVGGRRGSWFGEMQEGGIIEEHRKPFTGNSVLIILMMTIVSHVKARPIIPFN